MKIVSLEIIFMKCQSLFSGESEKKKFLLSADIFTKHTIKGNSFWSVEILSIINI